MFQVGDHAPIKNIGYGKSYY